MATGITIVTSQRPAGPSSDVQRVSIVSAPDIIAGDENKHLAVATVSPLALAWVTAESGGGTFTSTALKTATYTAVANDRVLCNAAGGDFTVNLPAAPAANVRVQVITCGASGIATVKTTDGASIVTIVGATGWQLDAPSSATFIFVNSQWSIE